jgi:CubicO group peptidase (beta-lactamase class C family)
MHRPLILGLVVLLAFAVQVGPAPRVHASGEAHPAAVAYKASPLTKLLDAIFTHSATPPDFSGSVLIAQQGKILLNKGYGYADVKGTVRNTARTRFNTDAVTVGFTGTAIMQLQEQHKLAVQDPMCKYLAIDTIFPASGTVIVILSNHPMSLGLYFNAIVGVLRL